MTQHKTVLKRINDTKKKVTADTAKRVASLFEGMDEKVISAARTYSQSLAKLKKDNILGPQGQTVERKRLHDQHFEPVRQAYYEAAKSAQKALDRAAEKIAAAAIPQSDTGPERGTNALMWQKEIDAADTSELQRLYIEHADDKDCVKLLGLAAKRNKESADALKAAKMDVEKAVTSGAIANMKKTISNLERNQYNYFYKMPDYIHRQAAGQVSTLDLKLCPWKDLEAYNVLKIPRDILGK